MNEIEMLGAAMGLGALSGLSLYLTVFVVGISLHNHWLQLSPGLEPLHVLGDPMIWGIAGAFYFMEFFADKVPWVDSLWDSVHTAIRPIGAMAVATSALGETVGPLEVMGVLAAGGTALATHSLKAGTRLVLNASPEPFSNVAASVTEDAIVVGGTIITLKYPWLALILAVTLLMGTAWVLPSLVRAVVALFSFLFGMWSPRSWRGPATRKLDYVPETMGKVLSQRLEPGERIRWAVPAITAKLPELGPNIRGYLVQTSDEGRIYFVGRKSFRVVVTALPLAEVRTDRSSGWLYDELTLYRNPQGVLARFRFLKRDQELVALCLRDLRADEAAPTGGTLVTSASAV